MVSSSILGILPSFTLFVNLMSVMLLMETRASRADHRGTTALQPCAVPGSPWKWCGGGSFVAAQFYSDCVSLCLTKLSWKRVLEALLNQDR